jgi:hypothetical protein
MLIVSSKLLRQSLKIYCSCRYQQTTPSLSSSLFHELKPTSKTDVSPVPSTPVLPSTKPMTKQQAQAAVTALGVGALSAVSNWITGLTSSVRKVPAESELSRNGGRAVSRETLEHRSKSFEQSSQFLRLNTFIRRAFLVAERIDEFNCQDVESKDMMELLLNVNNQFRHEGFQQ